MEMVERRDTGVTRHAGGWIVLGAGLLLVCLRSVVFTDQEDRPSDLSAAGNIHASPSPANEHLVANGRAELAGTVPSRPNWTDNRESDSRGSSLEQFDSVPSTGAIAATTFPRLQVDLNSATEAELSCIEGVGPALARRIFDYRQSNGGFTSLEELDEIPGVGPKLAAQLRAVATINSPTSSEPMKMSNRPSLTLDPAVRGRVTKTNEALHD